MQTALSQIYMLLLTYFAIKGITNCASHRNEADMIMDQIGLIDCLSERATQFHC